MKEFNAIKTAFASNKIIKCVDVARFVGLDQSYCKSWIRQQRDPLESVRICGIWCTTVSEASRFLMARKLIDSPLSINDFDSAVSLAADEFGL